MTNTLTLSALIDHVYPIIPPSPRPHTTSANKVDTLIMRDYHPSGGFCSVCDKRCSVCCQRCRDRWYCCYEHSQQDLITHVLQCVEFKDRQEAVKSCGFILSCKVVCVVAPESRWIACGNMSVYWRDPQSGALYGLTSAEIVDGTLHLTETARLMRSLSVAGRHMSPEEVHLTPSADLECLRRTVVGRPVYSATWLRGMNDRADITRDCTQIHINRRMGVVVLISGTNAIVRIDEDFPAPLASVSVPEPSGSEDMHVLANEGGLDYIHRSLKQPMWLYPGGRDDGECVRLSELESMRLPEAMVNFMGMSGTMSG